jgi:hypothetical protein
MGTALVNQIPEGFKTVVEIAEETGRKNQTRTRMRLHQLAKEEKVEKLWLNGRWYFKLK